MKKVLLVCFDNVGDLVFASALASAFAQDPSCELSLLCKDYTSRIAHLLPGVQQVFAADPFWDKSPNRDKGSISVFWRCMRTVQKQGFDQALIASGCWRTAAALKLIGIQQIWGLAGRKNRWFLSQSLAAPSRDQPVVAGLLQSFQPVLPCAVPPHCLLDRARLPALERPMGLRGKKLAVLHAFAGRIDRCAPLSLWEDLARNLGEDGYHVLWTGTRRELESLRTTLSDNWSDQHFVDTWAEDLLHMAWIWSEASLFVGHDSGPLHVAHALQVPVLGLYLPGEPRRTFPQGAVPYVMIERARPQDLSLSDLLEGLRLLESKLESEHG